MKVDRNIRFAGIVNEKGEVIEGGFQQGIKPLLSERMEQEMYVQSLVNVITLREMNDRLGALKYSLSEHEKVILLTFPLEKGILCISASQKANALKIRDKVAAIIKDPSKRSQKKV
ncbi:MAG: hypothetical protein DA330_08910 [Nitrososphaera sp.]|nr:hypothetical protein [Nitrososphaera sp.]